MNAALPLAGSQRLQAAPPGPGLSLPPTPNGHEVPEIKFQKSELSSEIEFQKSKYRVAASRVALRALLGRIGNGLLGVPLGGPLEFFGKNDQKTVKITKNSYFGGPEVF